MRKRKLLRIIKFIEKNIVFFMAFALPDCVRHYSTLAISESVNTLNVFDLRYKALRKQLIHAINEETFLDLT